MKYFVLQDFRGYSILQGGTGKQLVFNITYVEIGWIGQKNKDQRTNLHGADGRNDGRIHQRTHLIKLMEKVGEHTHTLN
jgi:hypothetical protein